MMPPVNVPAHLAQALADPARPGDLAERVISIILMRIDALETHTGLTPERPQGPSLAAIQWAVCAHYGIQRSELLTHRRPLLLVEARQVGIWLSRRLTAKSLPQIGRAYHRDHTSIHATLVRVDRIMAAEAGAGPLTDAAASVRAALRTYSPQTQQEGMTDGDH